MVSILAQWLIVKRFQFSVDILPHNVHILNGNNPDLVGECKAYEEEMKKVGGVDLFLGGIGEDGHIAFNEPGKFLNLHTLQPKLRQFA